MRTADQSIAQRLQAAGFSHKRDVNSALDGRHVIRKGGKALGRFDVFEAIELLKTAEG